MAARQAPPAAAGTPDGVPSPAVPCVAVLVHWVDAESTAEAVASLRASAPGLPVVLVDNGSTDGSGRLLRTLVPDATHIFNTNCPFIKTNYHARFEVDI